LLRELDSPGLRVDVSAAPSVTFPDTNVVPDIRQPVWSRPEIGEYRLRLAVTEADRLAACRLRFEIFNLELGEGLVSSYATGLDQDQFDMVCDHLLIEKKCDATIVGTYRMQSGDMAKRHFGYYSAREFDFSPFESVRSQVLELGRASIAREHRTSEVLTLLWRGITQYAQHHGLRYFLGCSSLGTTDPDGGWALYQQLQPFMARPQFHTIPTPAFELPPPMQSPLPTAKVPKLLKTYLAVGSRICGPPACDREFGTIDFLTLMDLEEMTPAAKSRFFSTQ
jgi:putative hemolysin